MFPLIPRRRRVAWPCPARRLRRDRPWSGLAVASDIRPDDRGGPAGSRANPFDPDSARREPDGLDRHRDRPDRDQTEPPCRSPICRTGAGSKSAPVHVQALLVRSIANSGAVGFVGGDAAGPVPDFVLLTDLQRRSSRADGKPTRIAVG